jgi:hypothetical protein
MTSKNHESRNGNQSVPSDETLGVFEILVKGHLDRSWSDWLGGLEVRLVDNGEMMLSGQIRDQAALMGILTRLHGLNLTLLSVSKANLENEPNI